MDVCLSHLRVSEETMPFPLINTTVPKEMLKFNNALHCFYPPKVAKYQKRQQTSVVISKHSESIVAFCNDARKNRASLLHLRYDLLKNFLYSRVYKFP
jgi:hypothetical protein